MMVKVNKIVLYRFYYFNTHIIIKRFIIKGIKSLNQQKKLLSIKILDLITILTKVIL